MRTKEQAAEIEAAERALAERAGDVKRCDIGNSAEDVQMVIAYVADGAREPLAVFSRKWRRNNGAAAQARIDAHRKPR